MCESRGNVGESNRNLKVRTKSHVQLLGFKSKSDTSLRYNIDLNQLQRRLHFHCLRLNRETWVPQAPGNIFPGAGVTGSTGPGP